MQFIPVDNGNEEHCGEQQSCSCQKCKLNMDTFIAPNLKKIKSLPMRLGTDSASGNFRRLRCHANSTALIPLPCQQPYLL
jgi:hypothetical protein